MQLLLGYTISLLKDTNFDVNHKAAIDGYTMLGTGFTHLTPSFEPKILCFL
jgi:hypothetical protein